MGEFSRIAYDRRDDNDIIVTSSNTLEIALEKKLESWLIIAKDNRRYPFRTRQKLADTIEAMCVDIKQLVHAWGEKNNE